ncbi:hypothetical protein GCM10007285_28860 [Stappia taiwanensis]|nr:cytochrome c [Stappia taiwanensis]GGE99473.1 hypothetical protein GCM10007285_28860 [Stappia taiwanensis]
MKRMRKQVATITALLALAGLAAQTGTALADAKDGARLARLWCAACHVVADDQASGSEAVPPFAEIANRPNFDRDGLAATLSGQHPIMPDMTLSRQEIADLSAYIASLAR